MIKYNRQQVQARIKNSNRSFLIHDINTNQVKILLKLFFNQKKSYRSLYLYFHSQTLIYLVILCLRRLRFYLLF